MLNSTEVHVFVSSTYIVLKMYKILRNSYYLVQYSVQLFTKIFNSRNVDCASTNIFIRSSFNEV